jgi:guanylate kinase
LNQGFNHQKHKIVCLLGVSSTGKSYLINSLIKLRQDWTYSPSYTTRQREKRDELFDNNIHLSKSEFIEQWHKNKLIGVIRIHQNYYDQNINEVYKKLVSKNVICVLHYSNIKEWKERFPSTIFVYIYPGDFFKWLKIFLSRESSLINKISRLVNGLFEILTIQLYSRMIDYRIGNDFTEATIDDFLKTVDRIATETLLNV